MKIIFGCLVNNIEILQKNLLKSKLNGKLIYSMNSTSASIGLNKIIEQAEKEEFDVLVLFHQDVYVYEGWDLRLEKLLNELNNWGVAGNWGAYIEDSIYHVVGKIIDKRFKDVFPYGYICSNTVPKEVLTLDEVCLILNLKTKFRFDENFDGFYLYGTYACLKMKELGYKNYVIDNVIVHNSQLSKEWIPDESFLKSYDWLKNKFPNYEVLSTVYIENYKGDC